MSNNVNWKNGVGTVVESAFKDSLPENVTMEICAAVDGARNDFNASVVKELHQQGLDTPGESLEIDRYGVGGNVSASMVLTDTHELTMRVDTENTGLLVEAVAAAHSTFEELTKED